MATLKQRLHKKNNSGGYDTVYLETSASMVLMSSGTTVEDKITAMDTTIADKAASSHNHTASNITSGTLSVARGGTGVTTLEGTSGLASKMFATGGVSDYIATLGPNWTGNGYLTMDELKNNLGIDSSSSWTQLLTKSFSITVTDYVSQYQYYTDVFTAAECISAINDYLELGVLITGKFTLNRISVNSSIQSLYLSGCTNNLRSPGLLFSYSGTSSTATGTYTSDNITAKLWFLKHTETDSSNDSMIFYTTAGDYTTNSELPINSSRPFRLHLSCSQGTNLATTVGNNSGFTGTITLYGRSKLNF